MKKYFLTGLAALLPVALTLFIAEFFVDLVTTPFLGMMRNWLAKSHEPVVNWLLSHDLSFAISARILALLFITVLALVAGVITDKFVLGRFGIFFDNLMSKMPLVGKIFKISKEVTRSIFSGSKNPFQKTALVPFINPETYVLGFVTGDIPEKIKQEAGVAIDKFVFIPNSPHPLSGFLILTPDKDIHELSLTTEEAFKFLFSAGLIEPPPKS